MQEFIRKPKALYTGIDLSESIAVLIIEVTISGVCKKSFLSLGSEDKLQISPKA